MFLKPFQAVISLANMCVLSRGGIKSMDGIANDSPEGELSPDDLNVPQRAVISLLSMCVLRPRGA